MRPLIATRAVAAALSFLTLAACGRHDERELTGWLKVDIVRPAGGTSGVIVLGPREEVFRVRIGNRWKRLGSGHPSRYMVLFDQTKEIHEPYSQPAALVDLNDRKGVQIVREGEETSRPVKEVFRSADHFSVPHSRSVIDFSTCRERAPTGGCRDLQIDRYDLRGTLVKTFHVPLGETYPECHLLTIRWYGKLETPIVDAQCARASDAQCLWLMPGNEGLVVRTVAKDRPPTECSDASGLKVSLSAVERFEVLE